MKKALLISSSEKLSERVQEYQSRGFLRDWEFVRFTETFGFKGVAEESPRSFVTPDFADSEAVERKLTEIGAWHRFERVVAVDEFAVYVAGRARDILGVAGLGARDARVFRDKTAMKATAREAGLRVPVAFTADEIRRAGDEAPFPLVVKPRALAGAVGVSILRDIGDFERALGGAGVDLSDNYVDMSPRQVLIEEWIAGSLFHLDGLVRRGQLVFFSVSEYLGTPMDYQSGKPLGSVTLESQSKVAFWRSYAERVIEALRVPDGAFHLEAFQNIHREPVFLELAARPGGGPIVPAVKARSGVDLTLAHLQLQLREEPDIPAVMNLNLASGYLIFPKDPEPQRRLLVRSVWGPVPGLSTLVAADLARPGQWASGEFFDHNDNLGSFLYRGPEARIRADIEETITTYRVDVAEVPRKESSDAACAVHLDF